MADKIKFIDKFGGGIVRDDKSRVPGAATNVEEIDIFSNVNYIQAEQIFSSDSLPASTEVYAYTADNSDQVWAYGKNTANNAVRLLKVTSGGTDNPGAFSTVFTSADTTDIAYVVSDIQYLRQDNGNQNFLYYVTNDSGTVKLKSYDITGNTESEQDSAATNMTLTGLDGSYDRPFMKVGFGELFVGNGQYIAKVDKDGAFTEKAFTLPNGWEAVDMEFVSDKAIILARNINRLINRSSGFWWDLTATVQVDDSFDIPIGGPQWIVNFKEQIIMFCAQNNKGYFLQLTGGFEGAVPIPIKGVQLSNVAVDEATQPVSAPKMVDRKDNVLYFGLYKTDKTGVYAIGQQEPTSPMAVILSKRFSTSAYANHKPTALHIQGPNFFAAFDDNSTASTVRCESNNSPTRSSNAVYETIYLDDDDPTSNKAAPELYITTRPLPASCDVDVSVEKDYAGSYTEIFRADGTSFNTTSALYGMFKPKIADFKIIRIKLALTSSTTNSAKVTGIGLRLTTSDLPASK